MHVRSRLVIALCATAASVAATATPVFAHVDPDPTQAQAGSTLSVGFTVGHGCAASPTIQLDMRLPDGAAHATPEPPDGWTGTVDGNVVTFQGGPLAADQEMTFRVSMTLPTTPDTTVYFPFVQRCETGEIRWIDIPSDGSGTELDEPAPAMELFGPVATTIPATTNPTAPDPTTTELAAPTTTGPAPTTAASTTPTTTTALAGQPGTTTLTSIAQGGADHRSGTIVFVVVVVLVVAAVPILIVVTRRRRPS